MVPDPTALALLLCEQVIVDQYSQNTSPINIFTGLRWSGFPPTPNDFRFFRSPNRFSRARPFGVTYDPA